MVVDTFDGTIRSHDNETRCLDSAMRGMQTANPGT